MIKTLLPINSDPYNISGMDPTHLTTICTSATPPFHIEILEKTAIIKQVWSLLIFVVSTFKSFLPIFSSAQAPNPVQINNVGADHNTEANHGNLSLLEVKKVIQQQQENNTVEADNHKIGGVFEEEAPSVEEVKEAFDIFDENKDGFIDANELGHVLLSLGFIQATGEDCKRMINGFDDNFDGRIDLTEFIKVMEKSFG